MVFQTSFSTTSPIDIVISEQPHIVKSKAIGKAYEIDTDFIFAYIGMTLGFIGGIAAIITLAALCLKVLSNATASKDSLGRYICVGVFSMYLFHSVINIGMVLAVFPVIGIPLPFISNGKRKRIVQSGKNLRGLRQSGSIFVPIIC